MVEPSRKYRRGGGEVAILVRYSELRKKGLNASISVSHSCCSAVLTRNSIFIFGPLFSFSPGDKIAIVDDSNEEWWRVSFSFRTKPIHSEESSWSLNSQVFKYQWLATSKIFGISSVTAFTMLWHPSWSLPSVWLETHLHDLTKLGGKRVAPLLPKNQLLSENERWATN